LTRPTLKERQHKLREDTILESTQRLLAEDGYAAMTMDDVANDVGISKATLYQHFKSKEELVVNVVLKNIIQVVSRIEALDPALPAVVRLAEVVRLIIDVRFGTPMLDCTDVESTIKPLLKRNPEFIHREQMLIDTLTTLVDAAKQDGDILPSLSTPILVTAFLSCIQNGAYADLLRNGTCTMADLETTLMGMIAPGHGSGVRFGREAG
jgi:TetR/AcrR family transcriptional regulator of autoinduction and epiphytic fitness